MSHKCPPEVKGAGSKRLHTVGFHLFHIQEKAKPEGEKAHQWLPGAAGGVGEVYTRDTVIEVSGVIELLGVIAISGVTDLLCILIVVTPLCHHSQNSTPKRMTFTVCELHFTAHIPLLTS